MKIRDEYTGEIVSFENHELAETLGEIFFDMEWELSQFEYDAKNGNPLDEWAAFFGITILES